MQVNLQGTIQLIQRKEYNSNQNQYKKFSGPNTISKCDVFSSVTELTKKTCEFVLTDHFQLFKYARFHPFFHVCFQ